MLLDQVVLVIVGICLPLVTSVAKSLPATPFLQGTCCGMDPTLACIC